MQTCAQIWPSGAGAWKLVTPDEGVGAVFRNARNGELGLGGNLQRGRVGDRENGIWD